MVILFPITHLKLIGMRPVGRAEAFAFLGLRFVLMQILILVRNIKAPPAHAMAVWGQTLVLLGRWGQMG